MWHLVYIGGPQDGLVQHVELATISTLPVKITPPGLVTTDYQLVLYDEDRQMAWYLLARAFDKLKELVVP